MKRSLTVYLGVYQVRLETPWAHSLKEKRALIKPVVEKLKVRFSVSVARLDGLDEHGWETLGVCALSSDRTALEALLRRVEGFIAAGGDYRVGESRLDLEVWDPLGT